MNNSINYDVLLESFEYDQERTKKYFDNLITSLESEAFQINELKYTLVENKYKEFENIENQYKTIKEEIIKDYLNNFKNINEKYNQDILSLDNTFFDKKNEILDFIDQTNEKIKAIQNELNQKKNEELKPYLTHIEIVNNRIDEEYLAESDFIFEYKDKLFKNKEFYIFSSKYLIELNKLLKFFTELKEISNQSNLIVTTYSNDNIIKRIDNLMVDSSSFNIKEDSLTFDNYKKTNISLYNKIVNRINDIPKNNNTISTKDDYHLNIDLENVKNIKKIKRIVSKVNDKRNSNSIIYDTINNYFQNKDSSLLNRLKDAISQNNEMINSEIEMLIKDETNNIEEIITNSSSILISLKEALNNISLNNEDFNHNYSSLVNKFNAIEIDSKIEIIKKIIDYTTSINEENKKLDVIAFELLSNKEVLKLKLLELKKEFLTIDDKTKIKEIEYDYKIKEMDQIFDLESAVNSSKDEINLLENDLLLDKKINLNSLSKDVYTLELKKNIDLLRTDYMASYNKLEELKKLSKSINEYDKDISILKSKIDLEKEAYSIVNEALTNKIKYDNLINSYNNKIKQIENDSEQKIRYLNDILEVERDNFTLNKEKASEISKSIEMLIYPELLKSKSASSLLIKNINSEYDEKIESILNTAKLAAGYKIDYLEKGKNLYLNFINHFNSFYNFSSSDGIDRSSSLTIIISMFKNYIHDMNSLLHIFNEKITYDEKPIIESSNLYLNTIVYKNDNTYIKNFKTLSKRIYINFKKHINSYKIISEAKLKKRIDKLNENRRIRIAKVVLNNTLNIEGYLSDIDKINLSKEKIERKFEDKVGEFKSIYLSTLDAIKIEYDKKILELSNLKELADINSKKINNNVNDNLSIKTKENDDKINDLLLALKDNEKDNENKIDETINNLNYDITQKNKKYDSYLEVYQQDKVDFLNNITNESKRLYQEFNRNKENNIKERKDLLIQKEENRSSYLKRINKESLEFKTTYNLKKEKIKESLEEQMINNEIEYSNLLNKSMELLQNNSSELINLVNNYKDKTNFVSSSIFDEIDKTTSNNISSLANGENDESFR